MTAMLEALGFAGRDSKICSDSDQYSQMNVGYQKFPSARVISKVLKRRKVHYAGLHMRDRSDAYQVVFSPIKRWHSTSFHFRVIPDEHVIS